MTQPVRDINVSEGIVALGRFKANASRLIRGLNSRDHPLVITQNGRPAAVVLSPEAFEDIRAKQRDLEAIAEGLADARAGRFVDHRKLKAWLKSWGTERELEPPRASV
jgi:prevent-host-death family protein